VQIPFFVEVYRPVKAKKVKLLKKEKIAYYNLNLESI
jgi:hypothetical protein